jgi:hypothetical protein
MEIRNTFTLRGDKVTGRVVFVAEKQEQVKSLKLNFTGVCITKTTRPFYVGGNEKLCCLFVTADI